MSVFQFQKVIFQIQAEIFEFHKEVFDFQKGILPVQEGICSLILIKKMCIGFGIVVVIIIVATVIAILLGPDKDEGNFKIPYSQITQLIKHTSLMLEKRGVVLACVHY